MTAAETAEQSGRVALVLDAGGARSAYQVGVLAVLLPELARRGQRPTLLVGTSAGALLSAALTATAHLDAEEQATRLVDLLARATKHNVMRPLWRQAPVVAARYASETLGLAGFRLRGLFGTRPLAGTLAQAIDWDTLHRNVDAGLVRATAVTTTAVRTGRVMLFAETTAADEAGGVDLPSPLPHRRFVGARLGVEHLMASAAIPGLFPSIRVEEPAEVAGWYVDGATRRRRPLAPALELGADRIVAVGTGSLRPTPTDPDLDSVSVDLGDGAATLLGAVMEDPMRHDLKLLAELNQMAADPGLGPALKRYREEHGLTAYRAVPYVGVAPLDGDDLAEVAMEVFRSNHKRLLRTVADPDLHFMHRLLGSDSPLQGELLSYLLFDPDFFAAAEDLGRRDAHRWLEARPELWWSGPLTEDGVPATG